MIVDTLANRVSPRYPRFICLLSYQSGWSWSRGWLTARTSTDLSYYQTMEYDSKQELHRYSSLLVRTDLESFFDPLEQLSMGIRYFDLRVCRTTDRNQSVQSPFTFTHGLLGHLARVGLEEINSFLDRHPQEIVFLDFNHFYDFNDQCGHDQLIHLIHEIFGKKLCTTARTIEQCTLSYLWQHQQQVILLYEHHADHCSAYMDRIGHFFQVKSEDCHRASPRLLP